MEALYKLPCQCRGSVSNIHASCFARWLQCQEMQGDDHQCDVCGKVYHVHGLSDMKFVTFLYHAVLTFFYYLLTVTALVVHWIATTPHTSAHEQFSNAVTFVSTMVCLHPMLIVVSGVLLALHRVIGSHAHCVNELGHIEVCRFYLEQWQPH